MITTSKVEEESYDIYWVHELVKGKWVQLIDALKTSQEEATIEEIEERFVERIENIKDWYKWSRHNAAIDGRKKKRFIRKNYRLVKDTHFTARISTTEILEVANG